VSFLDCRRKAFLEWAIAVMCEGKAAGWKMSVFPAEEAEQPVEKLLVQRLSRGRFSFELARYAPSMYL
jgi:hypothetical protein